MIMTGQAGSQDLSFDCVFDRGGRQPRAGVAVPARVRR
jgi:hypothetical protein